MNNKEAKTPVPFSVMSGDGESFIVKDKKYTVLPMEVGDALKFSDEGLSIGPQIFNLSKPEAREKISNYLSRYCLDENGESMSLDRIVEEKWVLGDLRLFVRTLVEISG
jgi:hypothetical protein